MRSVDRAGNSSEPRTYRFWVRDDTPTVTSPTGQEGVLGEPSGSTSRRGRPAPSATATNSTTGRSRPSRPNPDGTAAITVDEVDPEFNWLVVWSISAGGLRSTENRLFYVDPQAPVVWQSPESGPVGVPIEFTFQPVLAGTVSYTYQVDYGEWVTMPAGPDGTATVTVTPTEPGWRTMSVFSTNAAGLSSGRVDYTFIVDEAG